MSGTAMIAATRTIAACRLCPPAKPAGYIAIAT
jgi:hypothetical protein